MIIYVIMKKTEYKDAIILERESRIIDMIAGDRQLAINRAKNYVIDEIEDLRQDYNYVLPKRVTIANDTLSEKELFDGIVYYESSNMNGTIIETESKRIKIDEWSV